LPWLTAEGYRLAEPLRQAAEQKGGIDSPLSCVGWNGLVRGIFIFQEDLRPEAQLAIGKCRDLGLNLAVVTGDRKAHAERLAECLKIPVLSEQLPADKVEAVHDARRRFGAVAIIGDGINDAPALAASDIGIALGCGADLTRDSATVCLLTNDLARLPWTIELSRRTVRIIRQNLCWSFAYNVVGIALAATGNLSPVFSAMAMVASSVFVVTNSLRLNRFPEPTTEELHTRVINATSQNTAFLQDCVATPGIGTRELQLTS
jgi:P-type E1-E2 ATPase